MTAAVTTNASQFTALVAAAGTTGDVRASQLTVMALAVWASDGARASQFAVLVPYQSGGDVQVSQFTTLVLVLRGYQLPIALGRTFTSRGQITRPAASQESMTRTGPAQGKKRRAVYAAPLLADAQGVSMGVDFLKMRPLVFPSATSLAALPLTQTFSGVHWGPVDADINYDNMWCWEITRPYPCTLVAVEVQHTANENT